MKKLYLISVLALCLGLFANKISAQTTQKGSVKEYKETHEKKPLGGVELLISNAPSTISDKKGGFLLHFQTLRPGQKVNIRRIEKLGYEIFNKEALEQWNINPDIPFTIVMVKSDRFKKIRDNYSIVSSQSYAKQFEKEKKRIEEEYNAGKLTEEQLRVEKDRLQEEYDRQLRNLDNYIDRFARIDLSELSSTEKDIIELVQKGEIDLAIKKYEDLNLIEKYKTNKEEIKTLKIAEKKIQESIKNKEGDDQEILQSIYRQVNLLKIAGGRDNFIKIGTLLKQLALEDTTNIKVVIEYANFIREQRQLDEAIVFWGYVYRNGTEVDKIGALCEIGLISMEKGDYERCIQCLTEAKQLIEVVGDKNQQSLKIMASINIGLGNYNSRSGNFNEAINYYENAIKDFRYIIENINEYFPKEGLAIAYLNIGNAYSSINRIDDAKNAYNSSLSAYLAMDSDNIQKNNEIIGLLHSNLGGMYSDDYKDFEQAKYHFFKADSIFDKMAQKNPEANLGNSAFVKTNIGIMYFNMKDYLKSEHYICQAMNIYKSLYAKNPNMYLRDLIFVSQQLANVYSDSGRLLETENIYKYLSELISNLDQKYINFYRQEIRSFYRNYGVFFIRLNEFEKAKKFLLLALEQSEIIYKETQNGNQLCSVLELLVYCNIQTQTYEKALLYIDTAIEIEPNVANNYDTKGEILLLIGDSEKAKQMWSKVIELDSSYLESNKSTLYEQLKLKGMVK